MQLYFCDLFEEFKLSKSDGERLYSPYVVACVLNALLSYTTVVLNAITIQAVRKTASLQKPLKTLLLSLAVSDLGVGFASPLPLHCVRSGYNRTVQTVPSIPSSPLS